MNGPGMCLQRGNTPDRWTLTQHRPRIARALVGQAFPEAVQHIALLLPLCQTAQKNAAMAAVAALEARESVPGIGSARDLQREQGLATAWRWLITWPRLLGEDADPQTLRELRLSNSHQRLAAGLASCVPGLTGVGSIGDLETWSRSGECAAARLLARAWSVADRSSAAEHQCSIRFCDASSLLNIISTGLIDGSSPAGQLLATASGSPPDRLDVGPAAGPHDACKNVGGDSATGPIYVGPLAMARHPMITDIAADSTLAPLTKLFAAQLMDSVAVIELLQAGDRAGAAATISRYLPSGSCGGIGIGSAMTTRGPVFHVIRQTQEAFAGGHASDWTIYAPTDWHFSGIELVAQWLPVEATEQEARLVLAGLDPCCASSVSPVSSRTVPADA